MRVKIFSRAWSDQPGDPLEGEINAFLAEMPTEAVKYVESNLVSPRTEAGEISLVITIWYDDVAAASNDVDTQQPSNEEISSAFESAAGFDAPERFPKIRP